MAHRWLIAHAGALVLAVTASAGLDAQRAETPRGRALTLEDYYRVQTVGGTDVSPDGRWVKFTLATRLEETNGTRTETYVVPTDGGAPPRRVVHYGTDVTDAQWTRDGRLAYSQGGERWSIDPAHPGAAPARATTVPAGGVLSPDGQWVALAKERPQPKTGAPARSAFERRHEERFKGVQFDWKDFQRDGAPFPAPDLRARPSADLVIQPVGGGDAKTLVADDLRPANIVWHPTGRLLAFTADPDWRDELKYESPDLYTVTIDGAVTRLTADGYVHSEPGFSPDGTYLSYVRTFGTDMIIDQKLDHGGPRDLFVRRVGETAEPVNLTASWDLEPRDPRWAPDGRHVYFTAETGGEVHLFRASVPAGRVEQVTKGPRRLLGLTIDRSFTRIAYAVGVHDAPPDVYTAAIDGTGERRLTELHATLTGEVAFSRAERLRWPSYDGTEIEGWLLLPYGFDPARRYPLIVVSHGGPHSATGYSFDFKKQFFAANGYFVLDTNFRSSTGYGDRFKWATWGAWGTKDGEDVVSGVDYVLARYPIDPARVGHIGHSYGGFMTNWLITQYPDRFAAAVSGAGISNWVSDYGTADIYRTKETEFFGTPWDEAARDRMIRQSPLTYAGRVKTPTLFVHGEVDQRVPYEEGEQMYFALRRRGIPARMIQYADQPHSIGGHWNNVHRMMHELGWWERWLKSAPAAPTSSGRRER
ncbi:MAG: S9 family peptidase [Acidobacteriota bacterium]